VDKMSSGDSWGVNRHGTQWTSPVSVVSQWKQVCGLAAGLWVRRSQPATQWAHVARERTFFYFFLLAGQERIYSVVD